MDYLGISHFQKFVVLILDPTFGAIFECLVARLFVDFLDDFYGEYICRCPFFHNTW